VQVFLNVDEKTPCSLSLATLLLEVTLQHLKHRKLPVRVYWKTDICGVFAQGSIAHCMLTTESYGTEKRRQDFRPRRIYPAKSTINTILQRCTISATDINACESVSCKLVLCERLLGYENITMRLYSLVIAEIGS